MATFTASAAQSTSPAKYNVTGDLTRTIFYTHNVALSAGDVIQMVRIPNGAQIHRIAASAISFSAGVVTVNIGDGNDTSAYGASVVLSGSAVALTSITGRGIGRSYSAEDTIDFTVASISAPPATATIVLSVTYSNQG